jgi:hypothetical protein
MIKTFKVTVEGERTSFYIEPKYKEKIVEALVNFDVVTSVNQKTKMPKSDKVFPKSDVFRLTRQQLAQLIREVNARFSSHNKFKQDRHVVCKLLRVDTTHRSNIYSIGLKRCIRCDVIYDFDDLYCLCCGCKLRLHRRNKHATRKSVKE